jgi:serpin B
MHRLALSATWSWAALFGVAAASCGDEGEPKDPAANGGDYRSEPPGVLKATAQSRELSPVVDGRDLTALVADNTEFALSMFEQLRAQSPTENIALGPYSISQAMAMLYAGARGPTANGDARRAALHG